jgi:UDP-N-acetylmuramate dehydrogenase
MGGPAVSENQRILTSGYDLNAVRLEFGSQFRIDAPLARLTTAQVGGKADGLLVADSVEDLIEMAGFLWDKKVPFFVLGSGSNLLVSDAGVRGVVLLNKARQVKFDQEADPPTVWAASGTNFGVLARQAAAHGLGDLEWAAGIPGTVGGAVVGNAGAHGSDISNHLLLADILHHRTVNIPRDNGSKPRLMNSRENWSVEQLEYGYRDSSIKRAAEVSSPFISFRPQAVQTPEQPIAIVLSAYLRLSRSTPEAAQARIDEFVAFRRRTQPPGASMGSMFKNPPQDFAGRLIDKAGLKGTRVGGAGISPLHGNFFINYGNATAADIWSLLQNARETVHEKFGIELELEIQLAGEWDNPDDL